MREKVDVGAAIKELRGDRTQHKVANRAGIDPSVWSGYENARRMPDRASFLKIAKGLGCSPAVLEREIAQQTYRRLTRAEEPRDRPMSQAPDVSRLGTARYSERADLEARELLDPQAAGIDSQLRRSLLNLALAVEDVVLTLRQPAAPAPPKSEK